MKTLILIAIVLCFATGCHTNKYANETINETYMRVYGHKYVDDMTPSPHSPESPQKTNNTFTASIPESAQPSSTLTSSKRWKEPYPGMIRVNATTYMRPNAYGPGIGSDQYGRPIKTVPALK